jgi:hypothetical protein
VTLLNSKFIFIFYLFNELNLRIWRFSEIKNWFIFIHCVFLVLSNNHLIKLIIKIILLINPTLFIFFWAVFLNVILQWKSRVTWFKFDNIFKFHIKNNCIFFQMKSLLNCFRIYIIWKEIVYLKIKFIVDSSTHWLYQIYHLTIADLLEISFN